MVDSIGITNYKAFKTANINISPLTLLMGGNSSGKSSIVKLLLMLSQSIKSNSSSILDSYGTLTDLGSIDNLFHNKDTSKPIKLEFDFGAINSGKINKNIALSLFLCLHDLFVSTPYNEKTTNEYKDWLKNHKITKIIDSITQSELIDILEKGIGTLEPAIKTNHTNEPIKKDFKSLVNPIELEKELSLKNKLQNLKDSVTTLKNLVGMNIISSISIEISKIDKQLKPSNIIIESNLGEIELSFISKKSNRVSFNVNSNFLDTKKINSSKKRLKDSITIYDDGLSASTIMSSNKDLNNIIYSTGPVYPIKYILESVKELIFDDFEINAVHHVGPLRFNPDRYFLMVNNDDGRNFSNSGSKILKRLKEDSKLRKDINKWMNRFDFEIDTSDINDIIHSIKVTDNGLSLDITDVGFGISQVLPVILISLAVNKNDLVIIEQPEVHIHPKMQSALADFFIEQIKTKEAFYIIETHSEAILKRIRRRMAENSSDKNIGISNDDVTIHFFEKQRKRRSGAIIKNAGISATGNFEWPSDFRENDIEDMFEFMKHQG
ncbi:AAA family ATPase [Vibrio fluvialis]|nr:AAA family ATPase [Vibrio fluvialis]